MQKVHDAVAVALRLHPRVAQQSLALAAATRSRLAEAIPTVVPFRGREVQEVVALLDWDHRLPSRHLTLRLHLFYQSAGVTAFEGALREREGQIAARNLYPEFDVPDYGELPGDECYEAELDAELNLESMRLTSPWRREIERRVADQAVRTVRLSKGFAEARAATPKRPTNLGDLEAVAWMPPCESGHRTWTVDVWWLSAFDGRVGRGWSFLIDPEALVEPLVAQREFTVRTG